MYKWEFSEPRYIIIISPNSRLIKKAEEPTT